MSFMIPSKTFIAGEYLALKGGLAFMVATRPGFIILVNGPSDKNFNRSSNEPIFQNNEFQKVQIHPQSPAGRYLQNLNYNIEQMFFYIQKPGGIVGGLGQSSAELISAYMWVNQLSEVYEINPWEIQKIFLSLNLPGSGYDLISQVTGQLIFLKKNSLLLQKIKWPFTQMGFVILATGVKINTHEALFDLDKSTFDFIKAQDIMNDLKQSVENANEILFIKAINSYRELLFLSHLEHSYTTGLLEELKTFSEVLSAKGCGAQGADMVIIFYSQDNFLFLEEFIKKNNLTVVGSNNNIWSANRD